MARRTRNTYESEVRQFLVHWGFGKDEIERLMKQFVKKIHSSFSAHIGPESVTYHIKKYDEHEDAARRGVANSRLAWAFLNRKNPLD